MSFVTDSTTNRAALAVAGLSAPRGERVAGLVEVDLGTAVVAIPLVLVNGARAGRRVGITAGIHGAEYVPIAALQRVALELDPAEVDGSIVAVLTADPAAFAARSIYLNPLDRKNLNRVFPGNPAGTASDRLAAWLFQNVIAPADLFIDMHGGDMNEALVSYTGIELIGEPEIDAISRRVAEAYGLDYLFVGPRPRTSSAAAAAARGIPSVLAEVGGLGQWPEADVARHAAGLRRALVAAGVLPASEATRPAGLVSWALGENVWLRSEVTGYWHPLVGVGDKVTAGQPLGEVRDPFGAVLRSVEAPIDGMILFLVTSLAMNAGDPFLAIGTG